MIPPPYSTELAPLLVALGRAGIELARHPADAACLRHRPAVLPPDLSEGLRMHRVVVLGLRRAGTPLTATMPATSGPNGWVWPTTWGCRHTPDRQRGWWRSASQWGIVALRERME